MNHAATKNTEVIDAFLTWQATFNAADDLRQRLVGRRVQMISHARPDYRGPKGEIRRVNAAGIEVAWENQDGPGRTVSNAHPEDVWFI